MFDRGKRLAGTHIWLPKLLLLTSLAVIIGCSGGEDTVMENSSGVSLKGAEGVVEEATPIDLKPQTPPETPIATVVPTATMTPESHATPTITPPTPDPTPEIGPDVVKALIWPASVQLTKSHTTGNVDLEFEVWIGTAGRELSAADMVISFDKDVLEAVSVGYGDVLGPAPLVGYRELDNSAGLVKYAIARVGSSGGTDSLGVLARLGFTLKEDSNVGTTALTLKVTLADGRFKRFGPSVVKGATIGLGE